MGGNFLQAVVGIGLMLIPGAQPWVLTLGRSLVASFVLGSVSRAIAKKPSSSGATMSAQGRMETVRQPLSPWQVIYGRCRVGGTLTFFETTADNQTALMIVTVAGHPVQQIRDVYFNDASTKDYGAGGAGAAAGGRFTGFSTIYRSNGTEGAAQPFADLVARGLSWESTDLQRDRAKVHTTHTFSNDVWQTGLPQVSAIVEGVKDIYDPRLGSPGTHRWSNNPALVIAHYLTASYGLDADYASEIDETALIAAANICDERVALSGSRTAAVSSVSAGGDTLTLGVDQPHADRGDGVRFTTTGSLPGGISAGTTYYAIPLFEGDQTTGQIIVLATSYANAMAGTYMDLSSAGSGDHTMTYYDEPRYRLNGAFSLSEKPQVVLERMLMAMAGKLVNSGGVWYIYAGAYSAPTLVFDEDDLAGGLEIQTNISRRDSANSIKGTFVDPSNRFQPVDFPPVVSATYLSEDGGERVWRDLDLTSFVISGSQAQRLAKIDLITMRLGLTVRARFKLSGFQMMTGATVALSNTQLGWNEKAFEVLNCTLVIQGDGRLEVDATLRETAAEVYDWEVSEEQLATIAPNTNLPDPSAVSAPTGLTFTQSETLPDRGNLSWTAPSDSFIDKYQVEYQLTGAASWTVLPQTTQTAFNLEKLTPGAYNFRVKAINVFGSASSYATVSGDLFSAQTTSNYGGAQSAQGITKELFRDDVSWVSGGSKPVYTVVFCPANGKIYGMLQTTQSFSITPQPATPEFEFEQILPGRTLQHGCYVPPLKRMVFASQNFGSPTPPAIIGVNPIDNSIEFESAPTAYNIRNLTYCPFDEAVWAAAQTDSRVLRYDPSDGTLLSTIYFGSAFARPYDMAYCPTTNEMWVGDYSLDACYIVSLTGSPTNDWAVITPGAAVRGICYCPSIDRIVLSLFGGDVVFVDPSTRTITDTVALGSTVGYLLYSKVNDRIYAMDATVDDQIWTIIPSSKNYFVTDISIGGAFTEGCLCPLNNLIYVATDASEVVVIST